MQKTILITGSTDGVGLATAKMLVSEGHRVLIHGRSAEKLKKVEDLLFAERGMVESYLADLTQMSDVEKLAKEVSVKHKKIDALINNAGVLTIQNPISSDGFDKRFIVNTIAPYLLTKRLLPILGVEGRVVNVSSAAQSPVSIDALKGKIELNANSAYAQSKLALIMWSNHLVQSFKGEGPLIVSINPKSFLASKMVKEAYGVEGSDLQIGADILCRAALSEEFNNASGKYFDNDSRRFASPHPDALNPSLREELVETIEEVIIKLMQ